MNYALMLCTVEGATLDDVREAVTMLEESALIARRVLGSAHPVAAAIESHLRASRAALRTRETPPPVVVAREDGDLDEVDDA